MDEADLAALVLCEGLKRKSGAGVLGVLSSLLTSDDAHQVGAAMNLSGRNPFFGVQASGNVAQVCALCVCVPWRRAIALRAPSSPLPFRVHTRA